MARAKKIVSEDTEVSAVPVRSSAMELSVETAALKRALTTIKAIPDRKSTMPALRRVLVRVTSETEAELHATDLDVSMRITVPITGGSVGAVALDHKALADLVKRLPGKATTISLSERTGVTVKSDQIVAMLDGMLASDFPTVRDHRCVETRVVAAHTLAAMLKRTDGHVSLDETRFHVCGVKLEADGDVLRALATDGHRLALTEAPFDLASLVFPGKGASVPRRSCIEIRKVLQAGGCRVGVDDRNIYVSQGAVEITSKLILGDFPAWRQIIPSEARTPLVVPRKPLIAALERSSVLCTDTRGVKLSLSKGALRIEASDPDKGTSDETIAATYTGKARVMGFNPSYLIDALKTIEGDDVALLLGGELDPGIVKAINGPSDEKHLVVIMPMRI